MGINLALPVKQLSLTVIGNTYGVLITFDTKAKGVLTGKRLLQVNSEE